MVLATIVKKHAELLLIVSYLHCQVLRFVVAIDIHLTFLQCLDRSFFRHQLETGPIDLLHQAVAQLVVQGCSCAFVTVGLNLSDPHQEPDGTEEINRCVIPGGYVLQDAF